MSVDGLITMGRSFNLSKRVNLRLKKSVGGRKKEKREGGFSRVLRYDGYIK
jgi:hypothetical protein